MIELHYAPIELNGDIPCLVFDSGLSVCHWLLEKRNRFIVYLVAIENCTDDIDDIFVSDFLGSIVYFVECNIPGGTSHDKKVFVQEYESYEEAYEAALDMKEVNPLCYKK
jgi:hypothetical protein